MDVSSDGDREQVPPRLDCEEEPAEPSPGSLDQSDGAPIYQGFPLLEESRTPDGWCFGTISEVDVPEGLDWGDAFVVAPDDTRAGIVWEVGPAELRVLDQPDEERWGLYHIGFAREVRRRSDLVEQLEPWLPELQRLHREWLAGYGGDAPPEE
jgi:hypothetical protein